MQHAETALPFSTSLVAPAPLSHLRLLEAESIHILREVAAEFERPVMLYSIGKDSSVMLRLAQKAFHPGPIPFPLLHIDTGYKFREMLEFHRYYGPLHKHATTGVPREPGLEEVHGLYQPFSVT